MRRLLLLVLAVLGQLAISVPALATQDENNWNIGAFYGINFAKPVGSYSGVTVQGEQGSEIGIMLWIPLIPSWVSLRTAASYKTAVKQYTDSNLSPTSQFSVTENTYDGALGLQLNLFWEIYVFAEGKASYPTQSAMTINTAGGNVAVNPNFDFLQAYGLGYDLLDLWGLHLFVEGEYDLGGGTRPFGELNTFVIGQAILSYDF
jgi:hypothetical protein